MSGASYQNTNDRSSSLEMREARPSAFVWYMASQSPVLHSRMGVSMANTDMRVPLGPAYESERERPCDISEKVVHLSRQSNLVVK